MDTALFDRLKALPGQYAGLAGVPGDLAYLMGCRSFEQFCSTFRGLLAPAHHCPFCVAGREHSGGGGWYLKRNDFPLKEMRSMMLIIPKRHLTDPRELTTADWVDIGRLANATVRDEKAEGGAFAMRFGDPRFHAGTVPHMHLNVFIPTGEAEYRIPLVKTEEDREKNYARLLGYREELLAKGGLAHLFPVF